MDLTAQYGFAVAIHAVQLKNVLCQIDTNRWNILHTVRYATSFGRSASRSHAALAASVIAGGDSFVC